METKNYKDNIEPFLLEVGLPAMKKNIYSNILDLTNVALHYAEAA